LPCKKVSRKRKVKPRLLKDRRGEHRKKGTREGREDERSFRRVQLKHPKHNVKFYTVSRKRFLKKP